MPPPPNSSTMHFELSALYWHAANVWGYSHKYTQLPLIPAEEFLAQHPEHAGANENDLMVARIDHERAEREALEQQRQELLKRKAKLIAENKKRKDDLANLDKDLERFIDVSCPIHLDRVRRLMPYVFSIGGQTHPEALREGCMKGLSEFLRPSYPAWCLVALAGRGAWMERLSMVLVPLS